MFGIIFFVMFVLFLSFFGEKEILKNTRRNAPLPRCANDMRTRDAVVAFLAPDDAILFEKSFV